MNRRKILILISLTIALVGFVIAAIPFFASLAPSAAARNAARVTVKISDIPNTGALVIDYQGYKALAVRNPELKVFLIPYYDGAYQLPDPTWGRAIIRCEEFVISENKISCEDDSLGIGWSQQAAWGLTGKNKGTWMPDLLTTNFRIDGNYIILSPEYN